MHLPGLGLDSQRMGAQDGRTLDLVFTGGALDPRITFTRGSTGTYFDANGVLQTASSNVARLDYDPSTLAPRGLLIEESRQNIALRSADFNTVDWTTSGSSISVSSNSATAPDGTVSADKVAALAASASHYVRQGVTLAIGTTYTFTVYVKSAGWNFGYIQIGGTGAGGYSTFNYSTGALGANTTGLVSRSITPVGNGWYRAQITVTTGGAVGPNYIEISVANSDTSGVTTGDGTSGLYLWGAQIEAGAFATSYIPTTSAAVTRSDDRASITTLTPWFNASAGTLFCEFDTANVSSPRGTANFTDNTYNNIIGKYITSGAVQFQMVTGGAGQVSFPVGTIAADTAARSAFAFSLNDSAGCVNGGTVTADASCTVPTVDRIHLGANAGIADNKLNGHLRRVSYWPARLPNATLQALTA